MGWKPEPFEGAGDIRHRNVRVIRDYGMFERREAPQFYQAVSLPRSLSPQASSLANGAVADHTSVRPSWRDQGALSAPSHSDIDGDQAIDLAGKTGSNLVVTVRTAYARVRAEPASAWKESRAGLYGAAAVELVSFVANNAD